MVICNQAQKCFQKESCPHKTPHPYGEACRKGECDHMGRSVHCIPAVIPEDLPLLKTQKKENRA